MEELTFMQKAEEIYKDKNMPFASFHIDVPLCWEHEQQVLKDANFSNITLIKEWTNTKIYTCAK